MNLLELRTAFVRQCGHMNLVGVQKYNSQTGLPDPDGDDVGPDYSVDNGADYYINRAMKQLSRNMLTPRTKQLRRYTPEVGQTVILDPDIPITLSAVTQGNELLPLLDAASILYYNENTDTNARGPVRGYALGTLSAPIISAGYIGSSAIPAPMSAAWKFDGTSLIGKGRHLMDDVLHEAGMEINYGPLREYVCIAPSDTLDDNTEWAIEYSVVHGVWEEYTNCVGNETIVVPMVGGNGERVHYRADIDVNCRALEWPHPLYITFEQHNPGRLQSVLNSTAGPLCILATRVEPEFAYQFVPERGTLSKYMSSFLVFTDLRDLSADEREQFACAAVGMFPSTGIFLTPPSDGTPIEVEGWFESAPLVNNIDANYWTVNHAELIIDAALVALGAQLHNPSVRILNDYTEAQQRLLRVTDIASEVNSIGNRFQ